MRRVLHHPGVLLALYLAVGVVGGCDATTEDEFRDFEGSWRIENLEVADDDGDRLNSVFDRLSNEYDSPIIVTFSESDGVEEFNIFARRDKANTDNLNVSGDVQFSSGNSVNFEGDFIGENVRVDYRFTTQQLILSTDDFDGESLLNTLLPNWPTSPETPVVRVTLKRSQQNHSRTTFLKP